MKSDDYLVHVGIILRSAFLGTRHILKDIFVTVFELLRRIVNAIGGISEFNIYFACFGPSRVAIPVAVVAESLNLCASQHRGQRCTYG